jgi:hypothetical protein
VTNPPEFKLDAGRWQMVPVQPTLQMCEAMGLKWESPWDGGFPKLWVAALAASPSPPSEPDGEVVRLRAEVAILQNNLEAEEACRANISAHFDALNDECAALHAALATRPAAPDGLKLEKREFAGAADPGYDSHAYEYARGWNDCVDTVKHRAARLAPVALSSEERRCLLALEGSVTGHYYPAEVAVVCALVRRLTTNEPKGV